MIIVIPGAYNATIGALGNVQGQTITTGAILKVTERDRQPYPTDPGTPSEIWIDNTASNGYICKETGPAGTVWDRLDLLGDYIAFGDNNPGPNIDIKLGYRPGSLRYARNSQTLWICDDNTQGAAVWSVLAGGALTLQTNGLPNGDQTLLNIVQGANMTITDDGFGNITFDATGGGGTYTVNNGLTENPSGNFQLGGTTLGTGNLIRDTYITNDGYVFRIDQINPSTNALDLRHPGTGVNAGTALKALTGDGITIRASSTGSIAYEGSSVLDYTADFIRNAASINDIVGLLKLTRGTTGTSSSGIGGSIDFWIEERQTIPAPSPTDPTVRLAGLWENPGPAVLSRLSRFDIYGYSNGGALLNSSIRGDGAFYLYQYGINTFAGTPTYALGVDASGNVVEFTPSSGGTYTADNGLTPELPGLTNFQLGGTLIKPTIITAQQISALNVIRFDAPSNLIDSTGAFQFTAISGVIRQPTDVLTSFRANDCITAYFETDVVLGSSSIGIKIKSLDSNSIPLLIENTSVNLLKVLDSGQLELNQYTTSTSFQGVSGPSVGVLNVDSAGKVFVGAGGGGGNSIASLTGDITATSSSASETGVTATLASNLKTGSFGVTVDGVTGVVQVGTVGYVVMPYAGTITGWSITANAVGSIQFDIWKAANAIPTVANTQIPLAANRPKLTAAQYVNSTTLTGWTTTFLANDVYGFYVDSASTIKNATLTIRTTKT